MPDNETPSNGVCIYRSAAYAAGLLAILTAVPVTQAAQCGRTITANVVVLDNPTVFNRLGAQNPNWITYALRRDVVNKNTGLPESRGGVLAPGQVDAAPRQATPPAGGSLGRG